MQTLKSPDIASWSARNYKSFSSLVRGLDTPNTTCPACHHPVFYFTSNAGHGELFNSIGPNIVRHPCPDRGRLKQIVRRLEADQKKAGPATPCPETPDWQPFWVKSLISAPDQPTLQKISGRVATGPLTLYVSDGRLDIHAPFHVWKNQHQWYVQTLIGSEGWLVDRVFKANEPVEPLA